MGVYVYQSKHINVIKIGHYYKQNPWSRIAHRGFYSCNCPNEINNKRSVDDFNLICWFPLLTSKDEKNIHKELKDYKICGEWFKSEAIDKLFQIIKDENRAEYCSKEEALQTDRRL